MAGASRTSVAICRKRGRDASWVVFQLTDASGPKKYSRMLLSIPTTSKPWRWKKLTASLPISPDDPDTITELKTETLSSLHTLTRVLLRRSFHWRASKRLCPGQSASEHAEASNRGVQLPAHDQSRTKECRRD